MTSRASLARVLHIVTTKASLVTGTQKQCERTEKERDRETEMVREGGKKHMHAHTHTQLILHSRGHALVHCSALVG